MEFLYICTQLIISSEISQILIFTHTPYIGITLVFIHDRVVRARQLSLCSSARWSVALELQGRRFDSCQSAKLFEVCMSINGDF